MGKLLDLQGRTFGALTALYRGESTANKSVKWVCACACGTQLSVEGSRLKSGAATSCGCLTFSKRSAGHTKHGMYGTREYWAWGNMLQRCGNPVHPRSSTYGKLRVCAAWRKSFSAFYADMGPCPSTYELDRLDNTKGYSKSNCRWASMQTQGRNRRTVKLSMKKARAIRADTRPRSLLAKKYGVTRLTIWHIQTNKTWKE